MNGNCLLLSPLHSNLCSCRTKNYSTFPYCLYYNHSFLMHSLTADLITLSFKKLIFDCLIWHVLMWSYTFLFIFSHGSDMSVYFALHKKIYIVTGPFHYLPILNISESEISKTQLSVLSGSLTVFTEYTWDEI